MRMKRIFQLITITLIVSSCGSRYRYNKYELQEAKDRNNYSISSNWGKSPEIDSNNPYSSMKPLMYSGSDYNFEMYYDDPAYSELGFSPYINNAEVYKNYYEQRKNSWKTLWGILN